MPVLRFVQITVVLLSLALIGPALSVVASTTADPQLTGETDAAEITAMILKNQADSNRDNRQVQGTISKDGSVEFWSSGGLRQHVKNSMSLPDYTSLNIMAKDIEITTVVPGQAAVATFYAEGSMQAKGAAAVSNYLTRVTVVFVKEGGAWKRRAAHWSPIIGGAGTNQTAIGQKN